MNYVTVFLDNFDIDHPFFCPYKLLQDHIEEWLVDEDRPIVEAALALDTHWAYMYAMIVVKGRFPIGEPAIARDPEHAYYYANRIIKGRWPEGEPAIATDSWYSYNYAIHVLKGRFLAGEPAINDSTLYNLYKFQICDRCDRDISNMGVEI